MAAARNFPPVNPLRVLVADDDPIIRSLIRSKLGLIAGEVVEAADGLEAWQFISRERFQLALVDLEMPNLDGYTLIQCIRSHPLTRHMPIIVVTCRDDHAALQRALEAGASSYMTKPLAWSMFNAHVTHLLRLSATAEAAENALRRQKNLVAARQRLSAGLSSELARRMRRLRELLHRSAQSSEPRRDTRAQLGHVLANDIGALETAVEQYSATLALLDGIDSGAAPCRLSEVLREARSTAERQQPAQPIGLDPAAGPDFLLDCGRDALVAALAAALTCAMSLSARGVAVTAAEDTVCGGAIVSIVDAATDPRAEQHMQDTGLGRPSDSHAVAVANARLLIEAHGGAMELGRSSHGGIAIRLRLPAHQAPAAPLAREGFALSA